MSAAKTTEERYYTLPQVAKRLQLHRTTLLRMEQRGVIPKAKWVSHPIKGRVYNEAEIAVIETKLAAYFASGRPNDEGMVIDPSQIAGSE